MPHLHVANLSFIAQFSVTRERHVHPVRVEEHPEWHGFRHDDGDGLSIAAEHEVAGARQDSAFQRAKVRWVIPLEPASEVTL